MADPTPPPEPQPPPVGLYKKYVVMKIVPCLGDDPCPGGHLAELDDPVFVLNPRTDEHAVAALDAYARSARRAGLLKLADDILRWIQPLRR
jgi:hypothetical protein